MYPQYKITHRLRVNNLVFEVRDHDHEQDQEFEFSLPHFGLTCITDPNRSKPAPHWRLPSQDKWIAQRHIGIMPPNLPIRVRIPKGPSKELICAVIDQQNETHWSPSTVAETLSVTHTQTHQVISALLRELEGSQLAQQEMVASMGKMLLLQVGRLENRDKTDNYHTLIAWRMRKIKDAIRNAAKGGDFDLEQLADQCRMSKKYLLNQYLQATGHSLNDHIWSAKAEQAKTLIQNGQSFSSIAHELKYSGPSHFTARFASYTGLTPTEYRRQTKSG